MMTGLRCGFLEYVIYFTYAQTSFIYHIEARAGPWQTKKTCADYTGEKDAWLIGGVS